jgi:alanine-synthesizing transaminase
LGCGELAKPASHDFGLGDPERLAEALEQREVRRLQAERLEPTGKFAAVTHRGSHRSSAAPGMPRNSLGSRFIRSARTAARRHPGVGPSIPSEPRLTALAGAASAALDRGAMTSQPRIRFSTRSRFDRHKSDLQVAKEAALHGGRRLLDLTLSNPTEAGLPPFSQALAALQAARGHRYEPEPLGLRSAREAVSAWMGAHAVPVAPERIVLTASTSEAYAFLFKLLCDPGDEVLVPAPSYPLFGYLAQFESARVVSYPLHYDGHWHAPLHLLREACSPATRAVVTVHPNNPTGSYLKRDELAGLASLELPIICDEVFAPYPLEADPNRAASALQAQDAPVFSLHGLSKLAGLPQFKLAWICIGGPEAWVDEARARLELIADTFLSVATPVQLALPAILSEHAPFTAAIASRIARNLARLRELTAGSALDVLRVEGGWYAVVRLPAVLDDHAWALRLLEGDVWIQPGYFYDFATGPYIVLGLLTNEREFEQGVTRIMEVVTQDAGD